MKKRIKKTIATLFLLALFGFLLSKGSQAPSLAFAGADQAINASN